MDYTIKEIALRAGVSKSTVSRVISGKGYISPATREKVEQIIRELQYKPNALARAMVSQRTHNIGVIIYRQEYPIASHPFYGKILDSILTAAEKMNYSVFVSTDREMTHHSADFMLEKRVDGLILISRLKQQLIDYIQNFKVPYLMVNGSTDVEGVFHLVNRDDMGGRMAADYLIGIGHRNVFVLAGPQTHRSHNLRLKGFREGMEKHMNPVSESSIAYLAASTFEEGYKTMKQEWTRFQSGLCTAIFATNDMIALGAMSFLQEQSVRIPEQVGVMGFDGIDYAAMYFPSLTTIRVNIEEMGRQALTLLDKQIRQEPVKAKTIEYEPELIIRQST
ncbi:LacI family transcriptional regulator [Paenibacillus sp. KQZ6P-2]|uniref:LacI family transcriptional regulator n=1 Tax=Paenibacillus mangrovi TaxID=2931978 RepID=A0A9X1WM98_9BACL|nr:LacI family DNA-binding transcriptional regulator [Paenibacillus mangrovi]MCJ8010243.1 LacI family transcriptional regulator [Paenibacillus mangrovi]